MKEEEITTPAVPRGFQPPKAYRDEVFLNSSAARNIRILCEMTEPADRLQRAGVKNTLVLFGSARMLSPEKAKLQWEAVTAELGTDDPSGLSPEAAERLRKAKLQMKSAPFYEAARVASKHLAEWSLSIPKKEDRFYICSGGGPGIMEAANRGAYEAGAPSIGLGISLPFEQEINPYCTPEITFEFHYFMLRKWWFLYPAKGLMTFPGGFGTMDELFEMLTLIQTQKARKPISVILYGSEFWNEVINFKKLADWGVISQSDLDLFKIYDDPIQAADAMIEEVTRNFLK
jgi:uncharacterized protein (TIGR00730 family)